MSGFLPRLDPAAVQLFVLLAVAPLFSGLIARFAALAARRPSPPLGDPYREILALEASAPLAAPPAISLAAGLSLASALAALLFCPALYATTTSRGELEPAAIATAFALSAGAAALAALSGAGPERVLALGRSLPAAVPAAAAAIVALLASLPGFVAHPDGRAMPTAQSLRPGTLLAALAFAGVALLFAPRHEARFDRCGPAVRGRSLALLRLAADLRAMLPWALLAGRFLPWGLAAGDDATLGALVPPVAVLLLKLGGAAALVGIFQARFPRPDPATTAPRALGLLLLATLALLLGYLDSPAPGNGRI